MPATRLYKTEAVVLRQRKLGEADCIMVLYSPAYGKFEAKARGVRKTTSRLAGHIQPLNRCLLQLAQGHVSDVVTGCQTLDSFRRLREDLERLSRALYAVELLEKMTPEHVPGVPTYRLLVETLERLETAPDSGIDIAVRYFEMRLLDLSGFRPEIMVCLACGLPLRPQENFFAPASGGTLCPACAPQALVTRDLSLNALKVLRLLQKGSYREMGGLRMPPDLADEVERHLRSYVVHVLERDLRAAAFVERLRREAQPIARPHIVVNTSGDISTTVERVARDMGE